MLHDVERVAGEMGIGIGSDVGAPRRVRCRPGDRSPCALPRLRRPRPHRPVEAAEHRLTPDGQVDLEQA